MYILDCYYTSFGNFHEDHRSVFSGVHTEMSRINDIYIIYLKDANSSQISTAYTDFKNLLNGKMNYKVSIVYSAYCM